MDKTNLKPIKRAFVFPGQGSQSVGMGQEIYNASRAARKIFQKADEVLGFSLSEIMFNGPEEKLQSTEYAQLAIMVVSIACWESWKEFYDEEPFVVAGHSLGEYTSMVIAGVLSFSDAVKLVRKRGLLMQEAGINHPGGMAAILNLDELTVVRICKETGVELANVNTSDQITITGDKDNIDQAVKLAREEKGVKVIPLSVSGAFHSKLMISAKEGLQLAIDEAQFQDPRIPIVANCTGKFLTTKEEIKQELVDGLCTCVRWKVSVEAMVASGISQFIEFGPGPKPVLGSMIKRINRDVEVFFLWNVASIRKMVEETILTRVKRHKKAIMVVGAGLAAIFAGVKTVQHVRSRREKGRES